MSHMLAGPSTLKLPRAVYWLVALAFVLRIVARYFHGSPDDFWVNGYSFFFEIAQGIAAGKGIGFTDGTPETFRVPLYSLVLAGLTFGHKAFWPVVIAESAFGAAITFCSALLARLLFSGRVADRVAILAAAITSVYPYYVVHDTSLEETSLFTLLTIVSVIVSMKAASSDSGKLLPIFAGFVLGLDVLTRASIVPFAALVPIWLFWRKRLRDGIVCAIFLMLTVLPWMWRNYLLVGEPTLSMEAGQLFWTGNNGFLFRHYPEESSDISKAEALDSLPAQDQKRLQQLSRDDVATDRWFWHKALLHVRAHPWQTIMDGFRKNAAGFSWLPTPRRGWPSNLIYAVSYGPVMLLGLWGMWRRRSNWREDSLIILLFATFVLITAAFWAHTSHRSYLDVYWIVYGAGGLLDFGITQRRTAPAYTQTTDELPA